MNKDEKIIELLKEGRSYTYIQKEVQVSPSKIALIRKKYFDESTENSSNDSTTDSSSTTDYDSSEEEENTVLLPKSEHNSTNNNPKPTVMSNNQNFDESNYQKEKFELEKLRLQLEHEIALKKMQREEQELEIQRRDMRLKETSLDIEHKRTEKAGKALIFRFRKLIDKFRPGIWKYQQVSDFLAKAIAIQEEIEQHCFENDIDTDDLTILFILSKTIKYLEECIASMDQPDDEDNDEDENDDEEQEDEEDGDEEDDEKDDEDEDEDEDNEQEPSVQIEIDPQAQRLFDQAQVIDFSDYGE